MGDEWKGPVSGDWRTCDTSTTLSVLVSGEFQIEFRGAHEDVVDMKEPGDYVIFGPGIRHRSTALKDSFFLTIRWSSIEGDCRPVQEPA